MSERMNSKNRETLEILYRLLQSHLEFYAYDKPQDLIITLSADQTMKLRIALDEVLSDDEPQFMKY